MKLEIGHACSEPMVQDFLAQIGSVFGVGLEIESDKKGGVYRNFSDGKTANLPLFSSSLLFGSEQDARLNIYHDNLAQDKLVVIERLVREKLSDYADSQSLTHELLANYDKLNIYRSLAEQIIQPQSSAEAYEMLLKGLEILLGSGKCGIFALTKGDGEVELIARRERGVNSQAQGMRFDIKGSMFEKVAQDLHSSLSSEPASQTLKSVGGEGADIRMEGPFMAAPLLYRKPATPPVLVGFLFAYEPMAGDFTSVDLHAISTVSSLVSIAMRHFEALETARAATFEMDTMLKDLMYTFETLQQQSALIEQVNRISVRINSTLDLDMIFNSIADYTRSLLNSEGALVTVMGGQGRVSFPGVAGISREKLPRTVIVDKECILSLIFNSAKPIIDNKYNPENCLMGFSLPMPISNFITYPIESRGKIAAVIMVFNKKDKEEFGGPDTDFLRALAYQATTAIDNARLLSNLKQTQFTMMAKLSELAEKRDPETGEHLLRMQKYTRIIAHELAKTPKYEKSVDEQFINEAYAAAPLHDIGKVAIADSILLKRGKLTGEEFEVMKTHASVGEMILRGPDYLKVACEIAGSHHEKFDGTGYPHGLKGNDIPLAARIVAVADVYDALTSRRVYKEDMSHELSMDIIQKGVGAHFDPDVVAALNAGINEILTIKNLIR